MTACTCQSPPEAVSSWGPSRTRSCRGCPRRHPGGKAWLGTAQLIRSLGQRRWRQRTLPIALLRNPGRWTRAVTPRSGSPPRSGPTKPGWLPPAPGPRRVGSCRGRPAPPPPGWAGPCLLPTCCGVWRSQRWGSRAGLHGQAGQLSSDKVWVRLAGVDYRSALSGAFQLRRWPPMSGWGSFPPAVRWVP